MIRSSVLAGHTNVTNRQTDRQTDSPARHKIGYFGDVLPMQSLGTLLKKLNEKKTQNAQSKIRLHDTTSLSNHIDNRFDKNRLHRVNKHSTACQSGLTTGWMFVYTMQPVVQPAVQLNRRLSNRFDNRLYRVNGV